MNIAKEKIMVEAMIRVYCQKKEGNTGLCDNCRTLLEYAHQRLDHCPYGNGKGACKHCNTHCYRPAMRARIKEVMRFAGPRMIWLHPWMTLRHLSGL